jgi:chloramphenicol-sensitive protein RarD
VKKGISYAIGAYVAWGLLPVYWKWLHHVPALQVVSHRIIWSCIFLLIVIFISNQWTSFRSAIQGRHVLPIYVAAALLLSINWLTYIWAVNAGFIVETSLGYFINPLLSVLMGVVFLHEHLRPWQWVPVGLATAGVITLSIIYGSLPWIALTLALSFSTYGLLKKVAPLGALHGLALETAILFLPAVGFILLSQTTGHGAFLNSGEGTDFLLIAAGLVTTIPLLLFASATQRIPLTLVGILQYISPTLQFFIGLVIFREPFNKFHYIGFGIIWLALILFWMEGFIANRKLNKNF